MGDDALLVATRGWRRVGFACALGSAATAHAYESDQLTRRGEPLEDARPIANAEVDRALDRAIATVNRRTRCLPDDGRTTVLLAKEVHQELARVHLILSRGLIRMWGFDRYEAFLETGPLDRRSFSGRDDIYGGVSWRQSFVLRLAGPSATIRIGEVELGTDKLSHFWNQGFHYFQKSGWGESPEAAIAWGTHTELHRYGLGMTGVFSYADLRANWDGYQVYATLLDPESIIHREPNGCLVRVRSWDWGTVVDGEYDEATNPPVLRPNVESAVRRELEERKDEVCTAARRDGLPGSREIPVYAGADAPVRVDPFHFGELCAMGHAMAISLDPGGLLATE